MSEELEGRCTESYGFLPCSDDLGGSISLMVIYGYILLCGANILSEGSEMLLQILNPGIIGGLVLPILGALPDSLIIFVSGYGEGDPDKVAQQVNIGIGTLAGSTVMLLTIAYGGGILLGRCDRNPSTGHMKEGKLTQKCDFVNTGVTVDMQIPAWLGHKEDPKAAVIGAVLCACGLVGYAVYQIMSPGLQQRKMEAARVKAQRMEALSGLSNLAESRFGSLVGQDGQVDTDVLEQLFHAFDQDSSGSIEHEEMAGLLMGLELATTDAQLRADAKRVMREFDSDRGGTVSKEEFKAGITKWINEKLKELRKGQSPQQLLRERSDREEQQPLMDEEAQAEDEEDDEGDDAEGDFDPGEN